MARFNGKLGKVRINYDGSACPTSYPLDVLNARLDLHTSSPDHPQLGSFVACVCPQVKSHQPLAKGYKVAFDDGSSSQAIPRANLRVRV